MLCDVERLLRAERAQIAELGERMGLVVETARDVAEVQMADGGDSAAAQRAADELESALKALVWAEHCAQRRAAALERAVAATATGENGDDDAIDPAADAYAAALRESEPKRGAKEAVVRSHARMRELHARLWQIRHPGEALPGGGDGDDDDENDVAIVPAAAASVLCPITRRPFEDPVRNKLCGHTYSRVAIHDHIAKMQRSGREPSCPVAGCAAGVALRSLEPDREMVRELRRLARTQSQHTLSDTQQQSIAL